MTYEEAIFYLDDIKTDCVYKITSKEKEAIEKAIKALEKQIEIEKAPLTHICNTDGYIFPTEISIYARIVCEDNESVTIDRFQAFGALPIDTIAISRKHFEKYYKPIEKE